MYTKSYLPLGGRCTVKISYFKYWGDTARGGSPPRPHIVEKILLRDTRIWQHEIGKAVRVELLHNTLHPHVHGDALYPVHTVQQRAVRDLRTHAFYSHKRLSCLVNGELFHLINNYLSAVELFNAVCYVLSPQARRAERLSSA